MKLGLVSAILSDCSFEAMMDCCAEAGLECVEAACWPKGKAERKYAGVTHIDVDELGDKEATHIKEYEKQTGVAISSLAFYPNTLDPNLEKRSANVEHIKKLISASRRLGVNMVTSFIGRDQTKTVEENLEMAKDVWTPIIKLAEDNGVRIAIENCPMLFGRDQWPGGQNLMTTPAIWKKMFELIPSPNFGLNYDPSHFVWQMMDYIQPIYDFKEKIFHVHYKDIKVFPDKLNQYGIMAYPLDFMAPKLPGLGDVNWSRYVSALMDIGYDGYTCIELEDKAFEGSLENTKRAIALSVRYLRNFVA